MQELHPFAGASFVVDKIGELSIWNFVCDSLTPPECSLSFVYTGDTIWSHSVNISVTDIRRLLWYIGKCLERKSIVYIISSVPLIPLIRQTYSNATVASMKRRRKNRGYSRMDASLMPHPDDPWMEIDVPPELPPPTEISQREDPFLPDESLSMAPFHTSDEFSRAERYRSHGKKRDRKETITRDKVQLTVKGAVEYRDNYFELRGEIDFTVDCSQPRVDPREGIKLSLQRSLQSEKVPSRRSQRSRSPTGDEEESHPSRVTKEGGSMRSQPNASGPTGSLLGAYLFIAAAHLNEGEVQGVNYGLVKASFSALATSEDTLLDRLHPHNIASGDSPIAAEGFARTPGIAGASTECTKCEEATRHRKKGEEEPIVPEVTQWMLTTTEVQDVVLSYYMHPSVIAHFAAFGESLPTVNSIHSRIETLSKEMDYYSREWLNRTRTFTYTLFLPMRSSEEAHLLMTRIELRLFPSLGETEFMITRLPITQATPTDPLFDKLYGQMGPSNAAITHKSESSVQNVQRETTAVSTDITFKYLDLIGMGQIFTYPEVIELGVRMRQLA